MMTDSHGPYNMGSHFTINNNLPNNMYQNQQSTHKHDDLDHFTAQHQEDTFFKEGSFGPHSY